MTTNKDFKVKNGISAGGVIAASAQFVSAASSASLPALAVSTGTGIYNNGANVLGVAVNSTNIANFTTSALSLLGTLNIATNNLAINMADAGGTSRRTVLVSPSNVFYFGDIDRAANTASTVLITAKTGGNLYTDAASTLAWGSGGVAVVGTLTATGQVYSGPWTALGSNAFAANLTSTSGTVNYQLQLNGTGVGALSYIGSAAGQGARNNTIELGTTAAGMSITNYINGVGIVTTVSSTGLTVNGTTTSTSFSGPLTGNVTSTGTSTLPVIQLNKQNTANASGISWYSSTYSAWSDYMANATTVNQGPSGTVTAPSGSLVTSWGRRSFIENVNGYGWTFESGTSTSTTPAVVAEIRSIDGAAKFGGTVTAPTFSGALSGNASTATAIAGGAALQIHYQSGANATGFIIAPSTGPTYLQWTGSTYTWTALPFDIAQFINGKPLASEILVKVIFPRAVSFPANFSGSYAKCVVAPTSATTLTVLKNGVSVGTLSFGAGATTGTFSTSALSFSAADILIIQAPASVDATFADFACTLSGA